MKEVEQNIINNNEEYEAAVNKEVDNHKEGYELSTFDKVLSAFGRVKETFPEFEDEIYCMASRAHEFLYYQRGMLVLFDEYQKRTWVAISDAEKKRVAELTVDMAMLLDKMSKKYPDPNSIQNKVIKIFDTQVKMYQDKEYYNDFCKNNVLLSDIGYAFTFLTNAGSEAKKDGIDIEGYDKYMKAYPIIDAIRESQEFYLNTYKPYMKKKAEGALSAKEMSDYIDDYKKYLESQINYYKKMREMYNDKDSDYFAFPQNINDYSYNDSIVKDMEDQIDFLNLGWPVEDLSILIQVKRIRSEDKGDYATFEEFEKKDDFYNELLHKPVASPEVRAKLLSDVHQYIEKHNEAQIDIAHSVYDVDKEPEKRDKIYKSYARKITNDREKLEKKAEKIENRINKISKSLRDNFSEIEGLQDQLYKEKDPDKRKAINDQILVAKNREGILHEKRRKELEDNLSKYPVELDDLKKELGEQNNLAETPEIFSKEEYTLIKDNIIKLEFKINSTEQQQRYDEREYKELLANPRTVDQEFSELVTERTNETNKLNVLQTKIERKNNALKIIDDNEKKAVSTEAVGKANIINTFGGLFNDALKREVTNAEMGPIDEATVKKHEEMFKQDIKTRQERKNHYVGSGSKKVKVDNPKAKETNIIPDICSFIANELEKINSVDRFVMSSKEFKDLKKYLAAMNKKVHEKWEDAEYTSELKAVDFVDMAETLRDLAVKYLNMKEKQIADDPSRKDAWRKQRNEQPRIKAVIGLLERLDMMSECAEAELSATTVAWKEYVSLKKGTSQANAKDRIEKLGSDIYAHITSGKLQTDLNSATLKELVIEVVANYHITTESFYNQVNKESDDAYKDRIKDALDGSYVDTLKDQMRNNNVVRSFVENCADKLYGTEELKDPKDLVKEIVDSYKAATNVAAKAKQNLVSTRRGGKAKEQAPNQVSK